VSWKSKPKTTRRVLERVPTDKLSWKPHPKSMSLGELALHVAMSPGYIAEGWCFRTRSTSARVWKNAGACVDAGILTAHDEGVKKTRIALEKIGDEGLRQQWTATMNGATVFNMPKRAGTNDRAQPHLPSPRTAVRVSAASRRGRSVDLRPSADESPFATAQA